MEPNPAIVTGTHFVSLCRPTANSHSPPTKAIRVRHATVVDCSHFVLYKIPVQPATTTVATATAQVGIGVHIGTGNIIIQLTTENTAGNFS